MKNRALQVRMVKTPVEDIDAEPVKEASFEEQVATIGSLVNDVAKKAVFGVALYVVLDTGRKVAISIAER